LPEKGPEAVQAGARARLARLALAFNMHVLVYDVSPPQDPGDVDVVGLQELFERSDVVSLHCPLLNAANCFITPHIAWATRAARERLLNAVVSNVESFLRGERRNVVNPA